MSEDRHNWRQGGHWQNSGCAKPCDCAGVDCPNTYILAGAELEGEEAVESFLPSIDPKKCVACGECVKACRVNALYLVKGKLNLLDKICTGCEACKLACPHAAIGDSKKTVGHTYEFEKHGVRFVIGSLVPSEPISSMVVKAAQARAARKETDVYIVDTAAGIHCDVVDALRGCDKAFAVTEPTPFGISDLKLIKQVLQKLKVEHGVIANRSDITDIKIDNAVLEIPYDKKMMECYAENTPMILKYPEHMISKKFVEFADKVMG
jgi:MinD superfamily P-loop ATPase